MLKQNGDVIQICRQHSELKTRDKIGQSKDIWESKEESRQGICGGNRKRDTS